jgi:hypothetical protein
MVQQSAPAISSTPTIMPVQAVQPIQTASASAQPVAQQTPETPARNEQETPETLAKQEERLTQALSQAKQEEAVQPVPAAHQKVEELEKQVQLIHQQKQHLEEELMRLKTQLNQPQALPQQPMTMNAGQPATPVMNQPTAPVQQLSTQSAPAQAHSPYVHNVPQDMTKNAGLLNVSDTPNVVIGLVKDSRGNALSHILVEVKDENSNPVRAFKTNVLGQFASATPLSNGTYTIELEDPKKLHSFDVVKITPNGQIMMPIEIISHDAREELRKQLFN